MTKYYFVGTMREALYRLREDNTEPFDEGDEVAPFVDINEGDFFDSKAVKKEYGSLAKMKEQHGARYVQSITIDKRMHDRHVKPYMMVNGKRLYLQ